MSYSKELGDSTGSAEIANERRSPDGDGHTDLEAAVSEGVGIRANAAQGQSQTMHTDAGHTMGTEQNRRGWMRQAGSEPADTLSLPAAVESPSSPSPLWERLLVFCQNFDSWQADDHKGYDTLIELAGGLRDACSIDILEYPVGGEER